MKQINTGNILPFYRYDSDLSQQSERLFNSPTEHNVGGLTNALLPFQVVAPNTQNLQFYLIEADSTLSIPIQLSMLINNTATERIYTYPATEPLNLIECKRYYVLAYDPNLGVYTSGVYSEIVKVKRDWTHTLEIYNAKDLGQVMYQNGYLQKFHFDGYEAYPVIEESLTSEIDLAGNEVMTSYREVEWRKIQTFCIDSQLTALRKVIAHSLIRLTERNFSNPLNVTIVTSFKRYKFESGPSVDMQNEVSLYFQIDLTSATGCGENTFLLI